jgi:hypothetical protein
LVHLWRSIWRWGKSVSSMALNSSCNCWNLAPSSPIAMVSRSFLSEESHQSLHEHFQISSKGANYSIANQF